MFNIQITQINLPFLVNKNKHENIMSSNGAMKRYKIQVKILQIIIGSLRKIKYIIPHI